MPTYRVVGLVTISMHTDVIAPSKRAARKIAEQRSLMSLCHQCSDGTPDRDWVTSGALDGDVRPIDGDVLLRVEEIEEQQPAPSRRNRG